MIITKLFTDTTELTNKQFDDATQAERYAMAVLGTFTVHGTVCRVTVTDTMTGDTGEFEY